MSATRFVEELEAFKNGLIGPLAEAGRTALTGSDPGGDGAKLLEVALANEINVSELAAVWMPTTPETDVKIAFARQAGDEAGHFELVAGRLAVLGIDVSRFAVERNPLFDYLRSLTGTVERVAAGLFTLEAIACAVNENFMALCARRGDEETLRIYRDYIQPDERRHQQMGRDLLARYATTPELQARAKEAVVRTLAIATAARAKGAERLGTACIPGC
jgi:uncharacterized ferritin-like protein (DUF455 family)